MSERSNSNKGQRNTGYKYELLDREKYETNEHDFMAQMGNYDSRHEAIGFRARFERRFPKYDYEIRWHESLHRELDEPVVCGYCEFEAWYHPLVRWSFTPWDGSPFCCTECRARYEYEYIVNGDADE